MVSRYPRSNLSIKSLDCRGIVYGLLVWERVVHWFTVHVIQSFINFCESMHLLLCIFGFEGRILDLIVFFPDDMSFYI